MALDEDTLYGTLLGLRKIFILSAHIGLLSRLSENTCENASNVLVLMELKQLAAAATAGNVAGITRIFCRSCQPMSALWLSSGETSTVETAECLSLHRTTLASPLGA